MAVFKPGVGATIDGVLTATGTAYIGDTSNANVTLGLTINQGAADDNILALKSSDVAHTVTTQAETDTFAFAKKISATAGGLLLTGLADGGELGLRFHGIATDDDTGKATSADAYVELRSAKVSGTGITDVGANGNLVTISNNGTTRFIFDAEGDFHADSSSTTF